MYHFTWVRPIITLSESVPTYEQRQTVNKDHELDMSIIALLYFL